MIPRLTCLHTADWHIGRSLYGRQRYSEFEEFLNWLAKTIGDEYVDVLLVAGDVFDTTTPSNRAQELYYRFLCTVAASCCRHVVIIGGNHDSPSFLNAPKSLLRALNVYVVGAITEQLEDEVLVLYTADNKPEAIVCAVPYLRDKDLRTVESDESVDDKNSKLLAGLKRHYQEVCDIAVQKQRRFESNGYANIPIIAMGHLFTAGGQTLDGDGVRDLYVGSLGYVGKECFPSSIDYLALGHLHVPQCVGGVSHFRYSGSPIPMGYGETKQKKIVIIVEFEGKKPTILTYDIPRFQELDRVVGSLDDIRFRIDELKLEGSSSWLEIEYTGLEMNSRLREELDIMVEGSSLEIRRIRQKRFIDRQLTQLNEDELLDELDVNDVFKRCLDAYDIPQEDRPHMTESYTLIMSLLNEEDPNAD